MNPWPIRVTVLTALALTLTFAGPRAWTVLAGGSAHVVDRGPALELGRVGVRNRPDWLRDGLLIGLAADLEPSLRGRLGLLDEAGARALRTRLAASPWVEEVRLQRVFPDRMRAHLVLRRPELAVLVDGGDGVQALVDAEGRCLPALEGSALPVTRLPAGALPATPGESHTDDRVRAAGRVAHEWRCEIEGQVEAAPALVEVDASNLGYRYLPDGRWSEVRVGLRRADGGVAWLDYGHPPGTAAPRVPIATKVLVLRRLLEAYPGLAGVETGDLRFQYRWRDWVRSRQEPVRPR